jgi:hypothetical protein
MIGIHHGRGVETLVERPVPGEHDLGIGVGEVALRLGFRRGLLRGGRALAGCGVVIITTLTGPAFGFVAGRLGGLGFQGGLGFADRDQAGFPTRQLRREFIAAPVLAELCVLGPNRCPNAER